MDLGGATRAATTAAPQSTVSEKSSIDPEATAKKDISSSKTGTSPPDSTVVKEKPSETEQPVKVKDAAKDVASPSRKPAEKPVNKPEEHNRKPEGLKSPAKPSVTTTTCNEDAKKVTPAGTTDDTASSSSKDKETPLDEEDDIENDDLLRRLEALEKGEDPDMIVVEQKKEPESSHQNGLVEKVVEKPAPETPVKQNVTEKSTAVASDFVDMSTSSTEAVAKGMSPKKKSNDNAPATNKEESMPSKSAEVVTSNAKRKHPLGETEASNEPETKKVHIGNVADGPESSVGKVASAENRSSSANTPADESNVSTVEPPASERMEVAVDKPPSVEKMDVDASPEPETSSSDNLDALPDTEPNTESDEKLEEISSSVVEHPTRSDSMEKAGKSDHSNVSSSDDKRTGRNEKRSPPDSEVSASVMPTPSEDEAMDVDEDQSDLAESSTAAGVSTVSEIAVPVVEPPCVQKVAYLCYDEDKADGQNDTKTNPASTAKPAVATTSAAAAPTATVASTSEGRTAKMEVGSGTKATSSASAGKLSTPTEVLVDSSIKHSEKPSSASTSISIAEVLDESVVESSQPSSSSDSKKQSSDNRLSEQLREAVHRSGLLAKTSCTPKSSVTLASSSSLTPKTFKPTTTSAVSSSNVYSSTPIHANFVKVSSGNVSKISNPPSVETSRVEAEETTTTTSMITDQSVSVPTASEEKGTSTTASTSTTKSTLSATTCKTGTVTPTASSVKLTSPKKELLKREESNSTSSSSLKTTDSSEVDSCTVASALNTAEEISLYKANARKFNGISSTSDGSECDTKSDVLQPRGSVKLEDDSKVRLSSTVTQLDLSGAISPSTSSEQQYEVSVWYEGKDLQFLSVERIHGKGEPSSFDASTTAGTSAVTQDVSGIDSSTKQSSTTTTTTNGSVSSLGPFSLSENRATVSAAVTQSSDSSSGSVITLEVGRDIRNTPTKTLSSIQTVPQVKQTVMGPRALCDLIIAEFKKLRRTFAPDVVDDEHARQDEIDAQVPHTPATSGNARGQRGGTSVTKKSAAARGQKRAKTFDSDEDVDGNDSRSPRVAGSSSTTKQSAKKAKAVSSGESLGASTMATPKTKTTPEPKQFDICCLARWTDRKYYAGRVTNYRGDQKYVVVFEDGCSKTLSRDIIVFGENGILPILNHSIHALTGGDTYEPAIVEEIERTGNSTDVVYAVRTASSTLKVTATDIYLTDEQAKWIHNACKNKPDPMLQLLQATTAAASSDGASHGDGPARERHRSGIATASNPASEAGGDNNARSTRSKRGSGDKALTPVTPEAGYSGGVGKKGRRGRRKQLPPAEANISECSDASDTYEDEVPIPVTPETGLDAVDGVQPELQRTEQESELARMYLVSEYFGKNISRKEENLNELLGPIPINAKTLFRNKHFLLSCTIPPKVSLRNGDVDDCSRYKEFSNVPFVKQQLRQQIESGGGKVYQFFEDVPKSKYKLCKLIAPRPSTTALYVQCLASNIPAVSHEWIIQCCQVLMLVDHKPYALPCGWSFLENRYIDWGCGRANDKRNSTAPFASISINVASLCKDFNDFWSRVCKLSGATVRLIKTELDVTENLTGYLLTDQEFPELIKIKAARNGLLIVSTVWVVQCLIVGRVCHPQSHEKLTQIYQEDDY